LKLQSFGNEAKMQIDFVSINRNECRHSSIHSHIKQTSQQLGRPQIAQKFASSTRHAEVTTPSIEGQVGAVGDDGLVEGVLVELYYEERMTVSLMVVLRT
jgi:hypothetical protein